jgi:hypothetical protein
MPRAPVEHPEDHADERWLTPSPRASRFPSPAPDSAFEVEDDEPGPWRQVWITLVHCVTVSLQFLIIGFVAWLLGQAGEWWEHHGMWAPVSWVFKLGELGLAVLDVWMLLRYVGRHAFKAGH